MPRPMQRPRRPANRPGQTRGGRRGQIEAFERAATQAANSASPAKTGPIEIPSVISVGELAGLLDVPAVSVVKALVTNGIMATINQRLDFDTAAIVASDLGYETREQGTAVVEAGDGAETAAASGAAVQVAAPGPEEEKEDESLLVSRPPVVTIMGHVDHGKTSLLDAIRETKVAAGEAGGITQHIGAYQVEVKGNKITFLDTPGHEAFTAMRARGAQATDIAIIVVAADDGVMPQTREAIDHARAAGVPMVVAINKVDKDNAQPDRVKQELADLGLVVTEYGGTVESINVSAKTHQGLDDLLETVLLVSEAEVHPRANPSRAAEGVVIEAKMDKSRGAVATLLVQRGTLRLGDIVVTGPIWGRVKALNDDHGRRIKEAGPAYPVEVLGLAGVPAAGDRFRVLPDERAARILIDATTTVAQREEGELSIEAVFARIRSGEVKELSLIVKADVQGSVEPVVNSIEKLGTQGETRAKVIHSGLGNVNVNDVNLAVASKALIIAFNVRTEADARRAAELNGVTIRDYDVIYTLVEDIEKMLEGMLEPRFHEVVHGHTEVRQTFKAGKRIIAGCIVTDGVIHRKDRVRLSRGGKQLFDGAIDSLKRFKDDANEVREGFECGIVLDGWSDIEVGDTIEAYSSERI